MAINRPADFRMHGGNTCADRWRRCPNTRGGEGTSRTIGGAVGTTVRRRFLEPAIRAML
ncbi:hypothetical protein [Haladaptatus caseinilyticus]|uniref:hypothetical protein n=1 Tax=Haladaptatus caseinilyticus TaxID=2993314 RepID=UPI00224B136A|nr:hypothetical protein [Haladaptatus caseinilyticus]